MPTRPEQLRLRLTVMYNALAMIKLKHPGRNELTDINADLIEKYKDYLLGDYVYGLRSAEAAGSMIPPWTLVLGYEHAIRKFANKLVSQEQVRRSPQKGLEGCHDKRETLYLSAIPLWQAFC